MMVFLRSNRIINQQIDQHKPRDRWVILGQLRKTLGIKKTLDALFIEGCRGIWEYMGIGRKTSI